MTEPPDEPDPEILAGHGCQEDVCLDYGEDCCATSIYEHKLCGNDLTPFCLNDDCCYYVCCETAPDGYSEPEKEGLALTPVARGVAIGLGLLVFIPTIGKLPHFQFLFLTLLWVIRNYLARAHHPTSLQHDARVRIILHLFARSRSLNSDLESKDPQCRAQPRRPVVARARARDVRTFIASLQPPKLTASNTTVASILAQ
jgi:hypothetical protein